MQTRPRVLTLLYIYVSISMFVFRTSLRLEARVTGFLRFNICNSEAWGTPMCGILTLRTTDLVLALGMLLIFAKWWFRMSWSFSLFVPSQFDYAIIIKVFAFNLKHLILSPIWVLWICVFSDNKYFPHYLVLNKFRTITIAILLLFFVNNFKEVTLLSWCHNKIFF